MKNPETPKKQWLWPLRRPSQPDREDVFVYIPQITETGGKSGDKATVRLIQVGYVRSGQEATITDHRSVIVSWLC